MPSIGREAPVAGARITLAMCVAEVLGMLAFATYSANLPGFIAEWRLTNTEAGWLGGVFSLGNLLGIPVLVTLTDRLDARRIYLGSMALMGLAHLGFALLAEGLWSAMLFRGLSGIGFAGTYIPGLRLLSDLLPASSQARAVTFYSSGTAMGGAVSFLASGIALALLDWRWAYLFGAAGCALALLLVLAVVPRAPLRRGHAQGALLDFRPVLRNRAALAYVAANLGHNFENYGARGWTVAFLVFALGAYGMSGLPFDLPAPILMSAVVMAGFFGNYLGGWTAGRFGRRRAILAIVGLSLAAALLVGFSPLLPFVLLVALVFLHSVTMTMDNAVLNAGALANAAPELRGATMAVYGFAGFIGAMLGPTVFGLVLDLVGSDRVLGWAAAFGSLGLVALLCAGSLARAGHRERA